MAATSFHRGGKMNRSCLRQILSVLVILVALSACASPGQVVQSTPGIDPQALGTAVEGTARAAVQQTAAAALQPTATVMPGTALEQLPDGSIKFSDYEAGFEIIFPVGWLAVRPNSKEFQAILEKEGAVNALLQAQMTDDQATPNIEFQRVYAYALRPDIGKNAFFGFAKVRWFQNDTLSIDNVTMGELTRTIEDSNDLPGYRADTAQLHEDGPVKMIEIGGRFAQTTDQGQNIFLYSTIIYFKPSPDSTVRIIFTFFEKFHKLMAADVKSTFESIRLIEP
jgi:hypothetical protein